MLMMTGNGSAGSWSGRSQVIDGVVDGPVCVKGSLLSTVGCRSGAPLIMAQMEPTMLLMCDSSTGTRYWRPFVALYKWILANHSRKDALAAALAENAAKRARHVDATRNEL